MAKRPDVTKDPRVTALSARVRASLADIGAKAKPRASKRGNATLQAQAVALSLHPWNNNATDWARLEEAVTQLGASAPKAAKAALASRGRAMKALPNPFGS